MVQTHEPLVQEHPFFHDLPEAHLKFMTGSAKRVEFPEQHYISREGEEAKEFYAICDGLVSLELLIPGLGPTTVQTVREGEILGWSWITPPYRWRFDAKTLQKTRAFLLDADALRAKCQEDHDLGYEMLKRFTDIIVARLDATRLQLLDLYNTGPLSTQHRRK